MKKLASLFLVFSLLSSQNVFGENEKLMDLAKDFFKLVSQQSVMLVSDSDGFYQKRQEVKKQISQLPTDVKKSLANLLGKIANCFVNNDEQGLKNILGEDFFVEDGDIGQLLVQQLVNNELEKVNLDISAERKYIIAVGELQVKIGSAIVDLDLKDARELLSSENKLEQEFGCLLRQASLMIKAVSEVVEKKKKCMFRALSEGREYEDIQDLQYIGTQLEGLGKCMPSEEILAEIFVEEFMGERTEKNIKILIKLQKKMFNLLKPLYEEMFGKEFCLEDFE